MNFLACGGNAAGALLGGYILAAAGPAGSGLTIGALTLVLVAVVGLSRAVRAEPGSSEPRSGDGAT